MPNLYENSTAKLSTTDIAATPKYAHVGHTRLSFAHAVRETRAPVEGSVMVRYVFCVERNFTSVIVMGIRTAMERKKARVREMMRRWRMRDLRACVVRRYQSASSFSFSSIRFYSLSFSFSFGLGRDWLCCGFSTYSIPMHHSIQVLQIALPIIKPPILTLHIHFPPVSVSVSGKSRGRNTGSEKVLLVLVADGQRMLAVICLCGHGEAATRGGCWCYRCLVFFLGYPGAYI